VSKREERAPLTYREAGVDIGAGEQAVERIKRHVRETFRPEVVGDIGGFGGLFAFATDRYDRPLLVSSTDGVGTKSLVAAHVGRYDTIGIDLVAMSVDDVAVQGAEPLFFLDYLSVGTLVPDMAEAIVEGVAIGCRQAGCALLGGEMSEHPGQFPAGEFDLVGFAVGVVERERLLPAGVRAGDRIVGLASPGLRSNGYSLARAVYERAGLGYGEPAWAGAHHSLGDELLTPSVIYAPTMRRLGEQVEVHAFAHITGGGIPGNLVRVLPDDCDGIVRRGRWDEPRIFREIQRLGAVPESEMESVFNLGVGMLAVVARDDVLRAVDLCRLAGHDAWEVGEVVAGHGRVHLSA